MEDGRNFHVKELIIFSHPYTSGKLFKNVQHQRKSNSRHGSIRVLLREIIENADGYGEIQARGYCSSYMHIHMHMHMHIPMHSAHALCAHACHGGESIASLLHRVSVLGTYAGPRGYGGVLTRLAVLVWEGIIQLGCRKYYSFLLSFQI